MLADAGDRRAADLAGGLTRRFCTRRPEGVEFLLVAGEIREHRAHEYDAHRSGMLDRQWGMV